jgi:hypothetical protein
MWTTRPIEQANRRALTLLAVGGVLGVLLGLVSALHGVTLSSVAALPDDAITLVNGKPIREEEYANALALLAGDKRNALTDEDRAYVLTRLIEEELLVQHGITSGVVDTDRSVRRAMTQALLDSIIAESASELPTEDELRAFYQQHLALFTMQAPAQREIEQAMVETPAFALIRERVEAAYLQYARDEALREYLGWLRAEAKIVLAPEATLLKNLPCPPFFKGGNPKRPLSQGGPCEARGDFSAPTAEVTPFQERSGMLQ